MPRLPSLPVILAMDAGTCLAMGGLLLLGTAPLTDLTGLPPSILFYAGILLLAAAAIIAAVAARPVGPGVAAVLAGNIGWIAASLVVLTLNPVSALGAATIIMQALAVGLITGAEWLAWRRAAVTAA